MKKNYIEAIWNGFPSLNMDTFLFYNMMKYTRKVKLQY